MTEQKIEKIMIDELSASLATANLSSIQYIGAWQTTNEDGLKAYENGKATGILGVKVYPRQYETPTIPDGMFQIDVSLTMRADIDKTGADWLSATEAISQRMHLWQRSYQDYAPVFTVPGEFEPTGYNLAGGDCGLDRGSGTWQYSQTVNLYGIISYSGN